MTKIKRIKDTIKSKFKVKKLNLLIMYLIFPKKDCNYYYIVVLFIFIIFDFNFPFYSFVFFSFFTYLRNRIQYKKE